MENDIQDIPEYNRGQRKDPPIFPEHKDVEDRDLLEKCFKKDVIWALAGGIPSCKDVGPLPLLGSWTAFQKCVTESNQQKSVIEYMPVITESPNFSVCKNYLDVLRDIIEDLGLEFIFAHADEDVYAKLVQIIWKNGNHYKKVIVMMGGFHQLRVRQRLIYKRHACMGYKDWHIDSSTIAPGSADQAFSGKHYYRCMRVLKESFDALVQFFAETTTNNYTDMESELLQRLTDLRLEPTPGAVDKVLDLESFETFFLQLKTESSTQKGMTVAFLRDISSLLALVSAVREGDFDRHLQAERDMLRFLFAFDHQNYARYLSYQHVYLSDLKLTNNAAYQDLCIRGFGANYSGDTFANVHGDLVTEYFNKETKGTAGPFRLGYSTNLDVFNKWANNIHIHAKLRTYMREMLIIKTTSLAETSTTRM